MIYIYSKTSAETADFIIEHLTENPKKEVINERNQKASKCKNRNKVTQIQNEILGPNYKRIK